MYKMPTSKVRTFLLYWFRVPISHFHCSGCGVTLPTNKWHELAGCVFYWVSCWFECFVRGCFLLACCQNKKSAVPHAVTVAVANSVSEHTWNFPLRRRALLRCCKRSELPVGSHSVRGRRAEWGHTATPVRVLLLLQPALGRALRVPDDRCCDGRRQSGVLRAGRAPEHG